VLKLEQIQKNAAISGLGPAQVVRIVAPGSLVEQWQDEILRFDGTRLFPERRAYTANYRLSDPEAALYAAVTDYVKEEMNRADQLDGQRKGISAEQGGWSAVAVARARVEQIAMRAVIDAERALGHQVVDVSAQKCG